MTNLTNVYFHQNHALEQLPARVFDNLPQLSFVYLQNNAALSRLQTGVFDGLGGLQALVIEDSPSLFEIEAGALSSLQQLSTLSITRCSNLTNLHPDTLAGLTELRSFRLQENENLSQLPVGLFRDLVSLKFLYLSNNPSMQAPAPGLFSALASLQSLRITHNDAIVSLSPDTFAGLASLTTLRLSFNPALVSLPPAILQPLVNLEVLQIIFNGAMLSLPPNLLHGLQQLRSLNIMGNTELADLPRNLFRGLTSLTALSIGFNDALRSLPVDLLDDLHDLSFLDLSYNPNLTAVPNAFFDRVVNLTEVDVDGTPGGASCNFTSSGSSNCSMGSIQGTGSSFCLCAVVPLPSPSATPTASPTASVSPTPTFTPTPSATPSETPLPSSSALPTISPLPDPGDRTSGTVWYTDLLPQSPPQLLLVPESDQSAGLMTAQLHLTLRIGASDASWSISSHLNASMTMSKAYVYCTGPEGTVCTDSPSEAVAQSASGIAPDTLVGLPVVSLSPAASAGPLDTGTNIISIPIQVQASLSLGFTAFPPSAVFVFSLEVTSVQEGTVLAAVPVVVQVRSPSMQLTPRGISASLSPDALAASSTSPLSLTIQNDGAAQGLVSLAVPAAAACWLQPAPGAPCAPGLASPGDSCVALSVAPFSATRFTLSIDTTRLSAGLHESSLAVWLPSVPGAAVESEVDIRVLVTSVALCPFQVRIEGLAAPTDTGAPVAAQLTAQGSVSLTNRGTGPMQVILAAALDAEVADVRAVIAPPPLCSSTGTASNASTRFAQATTAFSSSPWLGLGFAGQVVPPDHTVAPLHTPPGARAELSLLLTYSAGTMPALGTYAATIALVTNDTLTGVQELHIVPVAVSTRAGRPSVQSSVFYVRRGPFDLRKAPILASGVPTNPASFSAAEPVAAVLARDSFGFPVSPRAALPLLRAVPAANSSWSPCQGPSGVHALAFTAVQLATPASLESMFGSTPGLNASHLVQVSSSIADPSPLLLGLTAVALPPRLPLSNIDLSFQPPLNFNTSEQHSCPHSSQEIWVNVSAPHCSSGPEGVESDSSGMQCLCSAGWALQPRLALQTITPQTLVCDACLPGTYGPSPTLRASNAPGVCLVCPPGTFSGKAWSECANCPPNTVCARGSIHVDAGFSITVRDDTATGVPDLGTVPCPNPFACLPRRSLPEQGVGAQLVDLDLSSTQQDLIILNTFCAEGHAGGAEGLCAECQPGWVHNSPASGVHGSCSSCPPSEVLILNLCAAFLLSAVLVCALLVAWHKGYAAAGYTALLKVQLVERPSVRSRAKSVTSTGRVRLGSMEECEAAAAALEVVGVHWAASDAAGAVLAHRAAKWRPTAATANAFTAFAAFALVVHLQLHGLLRDLRTNPFHEAGLPDVLFGVPSLLPSPNSVSMACLWPQAQSAVGRTVFGLAFPALAVVVTLAMAFGLALLWPAAKSAKTSVSSAGQQTARMDLIVASAAPIAVWTAVPLGLSSLASGAWPQVQDRQGVWRQTADFSAMEEPIRAALLGISIAALLFLLVAPAAVLWVLYRTGSEVQAAAFTLEGRVATARVPTRPPPGWNAWGFLWAWHRPGMWWWALPLYVCLCCLALLPAMLGTVSSRAFLAVSICTVLMLTHEFGKPYALDRAVDVGRSVKHVFALPWRSGVSPAPSVQSTGMQLLRLQSSRRAALMRLIFVTATVHAGLLWVSDVWRVRIFAASQPTAEVAGLPAATPSAGQRAETELLRSWVSAGEWLMVIMVWTGVLGCLFCMLPWRLQQAVLQACSRPAPARPADEDEERKSGEVELPDSDASLSRQLLPGDEPESELLSKRRFSVDDEYVPLVRRLSSSPLQSQRRGAQHRAQFGARPTTGIFPTDAIAHKNLAKDRPVGVTKRVERPAVDPDAKGPPSPPLTARGRTRARQASLDQYRSTSPTGRRGRRPSRRMTLL